MADDRWPALPQIPRDTCSLRLLPQPGTRVRCMCPAKQAKRASLPVCALAWLAAANLRYRSHAKCPCLSLFSSPTFFLTTRFCSAGYLSLLGWLDRRCAGKSVPSFFLILVHPVVRSSLLNFSKSCMPAHLVRLHGLPSSVYVGYPFANYL